MRLHGLRQGGRSIEMIYSLIGREYIGEIFWMSDRLISPLFPELNLMADQVLAAVQ